MDESSSQGRLSSSLQGYLAELTVSADLAGGGYVSFPSAAFLRYDLIVEVDSRPVKIQVKSNLSPKLRSCGDKNPGYSFLINRRTRCNTPKYSAADYDILALVALDLGVVAYFHFSQAGLQSTIRLRADKEPNAQSKNPLSIHDYPFSKAIEALNENP